MRARLYNFVLAALFALLVAAADGRAVRADIGALLDVARGQALSPGVSRPLPVSGETRYWLEEDGIEWCLPPALAAASDGANRIAGGRLQQHATWLWRLDAAGIDGLLRRLGLPGGAVTKLERAPLALAGIGRVELEIRECEQAGQFSLLADFRSGPRHYAIVIGPRFERSPALRREALALALQRLFVLPGLPADAVAPLLMDGTLAARLAGYTRVGEGFEKAQGERRFSVRFFRFKRADFASLERLQLVLEERLRLAGLRRTAGEALSVAGGAAYCAQYYAASQLEQIIYAPTARDWLVVLLHSHEGALEDIRAEALAVAQSLVATQLTGAYGAEPPGARGLEQARTLRLHVDVQTLDGRVEARVHALFDDAQGRAVTWQQPARWSVELRARDGLLTGGGMAASSLDFHPARGGILVLPVGSLTGEATLELTVEGLKATRKVTLPEGP